MFKAERLNPMPKKTTVVNGVTVHVIPWVLGPLYYQDWQPGKTTGYATNQLDAAVAAEGPMAKQIIATFQRASHRTG